MLSSSENKYQESDFSEAGNTNKGKYTVSETKIITSAVNTTRDNNVNSTQ